MARIVKIPVTRFKESKALRISREIIPKEIEEDIRIFLKKILKVNTNTKNSGIKNSIS